mgnify:CR=1 FL=1
MKGSIAAAARSPEPAPRPACASFFHAIAAAASAPKGVAPKGSGLSPMVVDAATVATMHSDAERIPIAEFHKGLKIFYQLLQSEF